MHTKTGSLRYWQRTPIAMTEVWKKHILENTDATEAYRLESVQSLWSGYGEIFRVQLQPESLGTLIVKQISPGGNTRHPRGWNTDRSLMRKLKSYDVESQWYTSWSQQCNDKCRIPECIASVKEGNNSWIILEDLDAAGYSHRHSALTSKQAEPCLSWLAGLHARFLHRQPEGLWPVGTYWHLDTRPDEFEMIQDGVIKDLALDIDQLLSNCQYRTIVHGDAKVANFCFNDDDSKVAAVDFQYVGGGCGMKDIAYFFGSCFDEQECKRNVPALLDYYFAELSSATDENIDIDALEREWRDLFAPAWTDFYRFLLGWLPRETSNTLAHPKIHSYTETLAQQTISQLIAGSKSDQPV